MEKWHENLRKQYEAVPVPDEAKKRMEAGIRKAKEERMKNNIIHYFKRAGGTAAAAVAAIALLSNTSPTIAQAMEQIPVIGAISQVVTFRTYENQTGHMEARVNVPEIEESGKTIPANEEMDQYAQALIDEFEKTVREQAGEGNYSLDSTYETVFENDKYVCIVVHTTVAQGGAAQFTKAFTIEKKNGESISLLELLENDESRLNAVSDSIKAQMREQMAADENVIYYLDSDMPEQDFKGLTGEESFYFSQNGELVVAFDEYQVAPGYMGAVEFTIPTEVTGNLAGN